MGSTTSSSYRPAITPAEKLFSAVTASTVPVSRCGSSATRRSSSRTMPVSKDEFTATSPKSNRSTCVSLSFVVFASGSQLASTSATSYCGVTSPSKRQATSNTSRSRGSHTVMFVGLTPGTSDTLTASSADSPMAMGRCSSTPTAGRDRDVFTKVMLISGSCVSTSTVMLSRLYWRASANPAPREK